jgi:hypothetical protein
MLTVSVTELPAETSPDEMLSVGVAAALTAGHHRIARIAASKKLPTRFNALTLLPFPCPADAFAHQPYE